MHERSRKNYTRNYKMKYIRLEIKEKTKEYLPYVGVVLAVILPWFFNSEYLFFTDFVWGPNMNLDWTSNWFLVNVLVTILSFIFSVSFLEKIFIGFTIFTILWGGRKLACYFTEDKLTVFIISLFALFNPFVYDRMMYGQGNVVLSFGFLLFAVAYLLSYLDSRENKTMIYFGVFSALALQFSSHSVFFIGLIFLLFLFLYYKKWGFSDWKPFLKNIFIAGALCLIINANWITADLLGKTSKLNFVESGITNQDLIAFKTAGSSNIKVFKNVLLMSGFWGKDQNRYMDLTKAEGNWGHSFLLILPFILYGAFVGIRKKETKLLSIGLLVIFVISVVLASGINLSYFKNITYWMFEHVPFYKGLRETQKWVAVVIFVYLFFLSIGLKSFIEAKMFSMHKRKLLVSLGAVIIMQAPFLLWGFYDQIKPTSYPDDWQMVNQELNCEKGEKILFLPWHLYMRFLWAEKVIGNPAQAFFECPIISSTAMEWGGIYDNSGNVNSKKVEDWLNREGGTDLLRDKILNIKYIILAKEADWGKYIWLELLNGVHLKENTTTLRVYEVQ